MSSRKKKTIPPGHNQIICLFKDDERTLLDAALLHLKTIAQAKVSISHFIRKSVLSNAEAMLSRTLEIF